MVTHTHTKVKDDIQTKKHLMFNECIFVFEGENFKKIKHTEWCDSTTTATEPTKYLIRKRCETFTIPTAPLISSHEKYLSSVLTGPAYIL